MCVLLGFLALALDVGQLLYTRRQLQTLADAAALAGALEIQQCGATGNCAAMQAAAKSVFTENGLPTPALVTQCAAGVGSGLTLQLNNGPCALGAADPNYLDTKFVEAVVSMSQPTMFAKMLNFGSMRLMARAETSPGGPQYCIYVLNSSSAQALLMNSNASLTVECAVVVDSNSGLALVANSGVKLTATTIDIHGGDLLNGQPAISPDPVTNAPSVADPLAGTPIPAAGPCGASSSSPYWGSANNVSAGGSLVFNPGVYCGGINLNGGGNAKFNPGVYVMAGSLNANSGVTMTGSGVTFYFSSGSLTMNGSSHANLVAPVSGTYAGVLLFQNKTDTDAIILNGDSTSVWQGALYAPGAQLTLNSGSNLAAYSLIDVDTLIVNTTNFTINSDYSSLPGGPPVLGTTAFLVE